MQHRSLLVKGGLILLLLVIAGFVVRNQVKVYRNRQAGRAAELIAAGVRQELFALLQPVALSKCQLERFGERNDGGYLLCGNLLDEVQAGYSYGISGYDQWGCDVSTRRNVPVHQYDCFNTTVPSCPAGKTVFHPECVAASFKTEDGRKFDSVGAQLAANGDGGHHIVLKMDVEEAEWESLLATSEDVLQRIDQIAIEFHGVNDRRYVDVVNRLKRFFHVAHIHFNNFSCDVSLAPFPTWAYEVLLVNKRLDQVDPSRQAGGPLPIDAPNNPNAPDCQAAK